MKPYCLLTIAFLVVLGSTSSAVAMMRAPGSAGSPTQHKPQHETKARNGHYGSAVSNAAQSYQFRG